MTKKYVVYGGDVRSVADGDIHYVGPRQVARLYGVDFAECCFVDRFTLVFNDMHRDLIALFPDPTGRYHMPGEGEKWDE